MDDLAGVHVIARIEQRLDLLGQSRGELLPIMFGDRVMAVR